MQALVNIVAALVTALAAAAFSHFGVDLEDGRAGPGPEQREVRRTRPVEPQAAPRARLSAVSPGGPNEASCSV